MSVSSTEALPGFFGTTGAAGSSTTTNNTAASDKDTFLSLLVAQMKYQDPMNPTDSSEFLSQSAQFTSLEKMQTVADQTASLLGAQMAFGASSLVGQSVSYTGADGSPVTGTVDGVSFKATGPVLEVGGADVAMSALLSVAAGSTINTTA